MLCSPSSQVWGCLRPERPPLPNSHKGTTGASRGPAWNTTHFHPLLHLTERYSFSFFCFFKILFLFYTEGNSGKKERERNINVWLPLPHPKPETWPTTQACVLTGNRTSDPLVHRPALNPLSHTSQGKSYSFLKAHLSLGHFPCVLHSHPQGVSHTILGLLLHPVLFISWHRPQDIGNVCLGEI